MRRFVLAILLLAAMPVPAMSGTDGRIQRGRGLAQTLCSRCHAVGKHGLSPLAIAPPFRDLHKRYPVEDLTEALGEGISTGHPTMPEFRFDGPHIDDLIAYLRSLE